MKQWITQNGKMLLAAGLALVIGLGGGLLLKDVLWAGGQAEAPSAEPVGQIGKPGILPQTPVTTRYMFLLCGHSRERDDTGGEYTGCTQEEIYARYPDARVIKLDSAGAVIERELERYCPAHFQIFMDAEGRIHINHTNDEDYMQDIQQTLSYDSSGLEQAVKAELEEGIVLDSLEEINSYFESVES